MTACYFASFPEHRQHPGLIIFWILPVAKFVRITGPAS